jgi:hypothetical protein
MRRFLVAVLISACGGGGSPSVTPGGPVDVSGVELDGLGDALAPLPDGAGDAGAPYESGAGDARAPDADGATPPLDAEADITQDVGPDVERVLAAAFAPSNIDVAGTSGGFVRFRLTNTGNQPVQIALALSQDPFPIMPGLNPTGFSIIFTDAVPEQCRRGELLQPAAVCNVDVYFYAGDDKRGRCIRLSLEDPGHIPARPPLATATITVAPP